MNTSPSPSASIEKPKPAYLEIKDITAQSIVHEIEALMEGTDLTYLEVAEQLFAEAESRPHDPVNAQINNYRSRILAKVKQCFEGERAYTVMGEDVENRKEELLRISPSLGALFKNRNDGNKKKEDGYLVTIH